MSDVDVIVLPGDLPDIFVVDRQSGLAIRVQDQVTMDDAERVGKARLALCVQVMQEFANLIPDTMLPPRN